MPKKSECYQDIFYAARRKGEACKIAERERVQNNRRPWGVYDEELSSLESSFGLAYPKGISGFVKERALFGRPVYALHLLGGTRSLRGLNQLSGGVAVTLNDFRGEGARLLDEQRKIELVAGDVFTGRIWEKVDQYLEHYHRKGFDLIYSSPILGWDVIGSNPATTWLLLDLAWRVLADDGLIILETLIGQSMSQGILVNFLKKNKIDAREKGRIVILKKKKKNPIRLPKTSNWG